MPIELKSVLEMAHGAILERVDYEMTHIVENILDVNTPAAKKRTLTVKLDIMPDAIRQNISMSATAKSTLQPTHPIVTSLYVSHGEDGQVTIVEMTPQVPGQMDLMGGEQAPPAQLRMFMGGK